MHFSPLDSRVAIPPSKFLSPQFLDDFLYARGVMPSFRSLVPFNPGTDKVARFALQIQAANLSLESTPQQRIYEIRNVATPSDVSIGEFIRSSLTIFWTTIRPSLNIGFDSNEIGVAVTAHFAICPKEQEPVLLPIADAEEIRDASFGDHFFERESRPPDDSFGVPAASISSFTSFQEDVSYYTSSQKFVLDLFNPRPLPAQREVGTITCCCATM